MRLSLLTPVLLEAQLPLSGGGKYKTNMKEIEASYFYNMVLEGLILDSRAGGLIIGPIHSDGGIKLYATHDAKVFTFVGEAEGNEYIINKVSTETYMDRLNVINSFSDINTLQEKFAISEFTNVFNVENNVKEISQRKVLWVDPGQYIINKQATIKYFQELEMINVGKV